MLDLNRVSIIGRLTRDPELRSLQSGRSVCTFSVATGRQWNDASGQKQKETEFHNVVMWGKLAEICSQYLHKASRLYVDGRLKTRDWTGTDGVKRYRTEIIGENMIMLDSKPAGGAVAGGTMDSGNISYAAPAEPLSAEPVIEEEIKVEDIPF